MKIATKCLILLEKIAKPELIKIEKLLDKLFGSVGIDIEFSKHFFDRLNDSRNGKPITLDELAKLYADVFKAFGKRLAKLPDDAEAIIKDVSTDINVPFILNFNKKSGKIEMTAKTIMRKKDFKSKTKFFKVG